MTGRLLTILLAVILSSSAAAADLSVRIGLLKFGTVAWEIETMIRHAFDRAEGIKVTAVEFATNEAAKVAVQAGAVDMIVTDWPWVARQRAEGSAFSLIPYSKAVGVLLVPRGSTIAAIADLKGRRIGVVGGPLDKSWLLLRALSRHELGVDLVEIAEPVFGAPPLLNEELTRRRIDALLTYWHHAARLEAAGAQSLMRVTDIIRRLGIEAELPMLGYAFRDSWAAGNADAIQRFMAASRRTKALLAHSDAEWSHFATQIGTDDCALLSALRSGYREGIPGSWSDKERQAAAELFGILADLGGKSLVGSARSLDPRTFWQTPSK